MLANTTAWCKFQARMIWFLFPWLRYQEVKGIGQICNPKEVAVIVEIPPEKTDSAGQEPLSLDMIEDPIEDMLKSEGLGYLDGHGFDLETGHAEIFFYLRRSTLEKGISAVLAKLRSMSLPKETTLRILDYETTELKLHDETGS